MVVNKCLQGLLWFVCAAHIAIGAGLNLIPGMGPFMAKLYGAELAWTPEFTYILKPLGVFMFTLGVIGTAAARDPLRHGMIVYGFAMLFVLRSLQRWFFAQEIADHLGIATGRNLGNSIFFLALAAALVVLHRLAQKQPAGIPMPAQ